MSFIQYKPDTHKGLPLYEVQTKKKGSIIAAVAVKSKATHEQAAEMPFYYVVKSSDISKIKKMVVIKGGPRSGNWGHSGLAGLHGGSNRGGGHSQVSAAKLPGKGAKKPKQLPLRIKPPKKKIPKKKVLSAKDVAIKKIESSKSIEVKVTPVLKSLAKKHGGEMSGLAHRLKTSESLAEKISKDVVEKEISEQEAADAISDAVRYTMIFNRENFVESVKKVQVDMGAQGWTKYDEKYKNFFSPGDPYDGYNTVLVNSSGDRFELQFHTFESIEIKHKVHSIYKKFGSLPPTSPQRVKLYDQMTKMWEDYERPEKWETLPGVRK